MSIFRVKLAEEKKYIPKKDVVKKEDVEFTSSKSQKPFSPADEEPEFDPSRDSESTVPSEIQAISALNKEQQKHIMTAKKEEKANDPEYIYYVLNKEGNRIRTGWTCKEDAVDGKEDDDPEYAGKIVHKKNLKNYGIDPEDNKFWKVDYKKKEEPEEKKASQKPTLIGKELKASFSYLGSTEARDDVFYAEEKEKEDNDKD